MAAMYKHAGANAALYASGGSLASENQEAVARARAERTAKVDVLKTQLKTIYGLGFAHFTESVQAQVFTPGQAALPRVPQKYSNVIKAEHAKLGLDLAKINASLAANANDRL